MLPLAKVFFHTKPKTSAHELPEEWPNPDQADPTDRPADSAAESPSAADCLESKVTVEKTSSIPGKLI